ncbi:MAG: hypothetical protein GY927_08230 [bacterium]|nr:hypothetical protein [bacterium]
MPIFNFIITSNANDNITGTSGRDFVISCGGDDVISTGDGNDIIFSGRGNDVVDAGSGNDCVIAGRGDDIVDGGEGNDYISGGRGNDVLTGGSGNDFIMAGSGDDTAIYVFADNVGNNDIYKGGCGVDSLRLVLTKDEWLRSDVQTDIAAYQQFLQDHTRSNGQADYRHFHFAALGLTASQFENLEIIVDGVILDPADEAVLAHDDAVDVLEGGSVSDNVTDNDDIPDLLQGVTLISGPNKGILTLNVDGSFTYDTAGEFEALADGETTTQTFTYEVEDADGDTSQATVTLTITGTNDIPTITGDISGGVTEDGVLVATGTLTVADIDSGESSAQAQIGTTGTYGSFDVTTAGAWSYTLDNANGAVQALAAGATLSETFTVTSFDGTNSETVTITITGTNDEPEITGGVISGSVSELPNNDPGENQDTHTSTGTIDFSDIDLADGHSVGVSANGINYRGQLIANVSDPSTNDGSGQVSWTFSVDDADLDDLAAGDLLMQTYTLSVDDGNGGTDTQIVTITFSGAADNTAPVVTGSTVSFDEDSSYAVMLSDLGYSDADSDALDHITITTLPGAGVLTLNSVAVSVGAQVSLAQLNAGALEFTPVADASGTGYASFDFTASDGEEDSAAATVVLDVTPVADAPTVTASLGQTSVQPGETVALDITALLNDTDGSETITQIRVSDLPPGAILSAGTVQTDGSVILTSAELSGLTITVPTSAFADAFELSSLDGSDGFVLNGIDAGDTSGYSVAGAGDVNGDGYDDLIISANRADPNGVDSGESYVVFGQAGGFASSMDLSTLNGSNGFVLNGIDASDNIGDSVAGAGDVNGDGYDDLIIGANRADPNGSESGESYVVFGQAGSFASSMDLSTLNGSDGFVLNGIDGYDYSGNSVAGAGDVNGDGYDDLIIGANSADPNGVDSGESYVVFGQAGSFASSMDLSTLDGSDGFVLNGIDANDNSGYSVAGAGDVNGDGYDDLIIGARSADPNGSNSGASYVVYGGDFLVA